MKKIFVIIALAVLMLFTSCEPSVNVPSQPVAEDEAPILSYARMGTPNNSKGLTVSIEDLSVDHFEYKFTYLGHKSYDGLAVGETDGWTYIKQTPNDWKFYLEQGLWKFEAKAVYTDETSHTFDSYEGYVNKKENALSLYIDILLSSYDEHGTGSIIFDDLKLPALYADRNDFYVKYELINAYTSTVVKSGTVPMAEVKSGDGVATMEDFRVDNISAGDYSVSILVYEHVDALHEDAVKSGVVAEGIKVYSGCNSTVTGTFGDDGSYLNATVRTYQASTTFMGKVKVGDNLSSSLGSTNSEFTFTCTADTPKNIRWFVDGVEQTRLKTIESTFVRNETHYYYTCPSPTCDCVDTLSDPRDRVEYSTSRYARNSTYTCEECGYEALGNVWLQYEEARTVPIYEDREVTKDADGTEDELIISLSQMGHGNSGVTTHYIECIYVDVEGHISSSSHELVVGSNNFPTISGSSVFTMGDGNEIKYWILELEPDSSLVENGFDSYSSAMGEVKVDKDTGIWISEGLWNVKSASAYDVNDTPLISTSNAKKIYINRQNPYINIEDAVKSETNLKGRIKIRNLNMNTLTWSCNYASGSLNTSNVRTKVSIYKLTEDGRDDSSFSPIEITTSDCTWIDGESEVNGGSYRYSKDTYQLFDDDGQTFEVPEGTYRVQINVNSGTRPNYKSTYKSGKMTNESKYSGKTGGYLEVIVNVSANTTQTVTGTLSCNHCIKTNTNY